MLCIIRFHIGVSKIFNKLNGFSSEKKIKNLPYENEVFYNRDFCITCIMWAAKNVQTVIMIEINEFVLIIHDTFSKKKRQNRCNPLYFKCITSSLYFFSKVYSKIFIKIYVLHL